MAYNFHFIASIFILIVSLPNDSHQSPSPQTSTIVISAAPALLPDDPHYAELSPDIAPLFPSPGGQARPDFPMIPSSRTPNPDAMESVGPDTSALAPTGGPLQESSSGKGVARVEVFCGCLACWLVMFFVL